MLHNPDDYPEPEIFRPERFIEDGKLNPKVRDPLTLAFGFGRRSVSPNLQILRCLMKKSASNLVGFAPGAI